MKVIYWYIFHYFLNNVFGFRQQNVQSQYCVQVYIHLPRLLLASTSIFTNGIILPLPLSLLFPRERKRIVDTRTRCSAVGKIDHDAATVATELRSRPVQNLAVRQSVPNLGPVCGTPARRDIRRLNPSRIEMFRWRTRSCIERFAFDKSIWPWRP